MQNAVNGLQRRYQSCHFLEKLEEKRNLFITLLSSKLQAPFVELPLLIARRTRSGVSGSSVMRAPVASATALATAAPPGMTGGSPTGFAPYGPIGDGTSTRTASSSGIWRAFGTV